MDEIAVASLLSRFAERSGLTRGVTGFCDASSRGAAETGRLSMCCADLPEVRFEAAA